jgi:hypothetical protein
MAEHLFTVNIKGVLERHFPGQSEAIFSNSPLIQYLNNKTRSASNGSKSRSSFANIYAIYVLVEDYISNDYHVSGDYVNYPGSFYKNLFKRQRELPFGAKLQNHALNNRLNSEFLKWFPNLDIVPITRVAESERYWINEALLKVELKNDQVNIAEAIIEIIDDYIATKKDSLDRFLRTCSDLQNIEGEDQSKVNEFILGQLAPNVDARLFEIVSYAILKYYFNDQVIYWGYEIQSIKEENLKLFKTGRTNANDGGIDFVMQPLGRFFQVTETLDFKKYFLDIDKLQKYKLTFIIKSEEETDILTKKIEADALKTYSVRRVVDHYMACIEELINITELKKRFAIAVQNGYLSSILNEIIVQSKIEFNYEEVDEDEENITDND